MAYSIQYYATGLGLWVEWQTVKTAAQAKRLETELKTTFKTRIVKER